MLSSPLDIQGTLGSPFVTVTSNLFGSVNTLGILTTDGGQGVQLIGGDSPLATIAGRSAELKGGIGNTTGVGGYARVYGGDGGATDAAGGEAILLGGAGGGTNGNGGDVVITGGDAAGGTGNAGGIRMFGGTPGSGTDGAIHIEPAGGAGGGGAATALRFYEDDASGSNYFSLQAAATMAGNNAYTWPNAFPAASGYSLTCTTAGVMSWTNVSGGGGGAQIFRANLTEAGSDDFVINTGFGNAANEVVSITVRDNNNEIVVPDSVTFDATLDQVTINLASYRAAGGGTLPAGFRVLAVG